MPSENLFSWTAELERLLGTMPDETLAQRLGCSHQRISDRRRKLRIPSFGPARRRWSRVEDELLGTMPDKQFARKFNRPVGAVLQRRLTKHIPVFDRQRHLWTPADDKLLSERQDVQIALLLGISPTAVGRRRVRLGISQPGRNVWMRSKNAVSCNSSGNSSK